MSVIFKGDSIYKSGGGGGGYKDGGALVDGDFIKVENNTISSYTNNSRDTINFYFDVKQGEFINSVIELTNNYNATVNVYVFDSNTDMLVPIGYVGGNTVSSGNEYNVIVDNNSFTVDDITPNINPDEINIKIGNSFYTMIKINGIYWLTTDYQGGISGVVKEHGFYWLTNNLQHASFPNGLRIPTQSDFYSLKQYCFDGGYGNADLGKALKGSGWNGSNPATVGVNFAKLNFRGVGTWNRYSEEVDEVGNYGFWVLNASIGNTLMLSDQSSGYTIYSSYDYQQQYVSIRLCKDA